MKIERRKFLTQTLGFVVTGVAAKYGLFRVAKAVAIVPAAAPVVAPVVAAGVYGAGVRAQVFEVIVRQGMAGAPWKEICLGPMQVNDISAKEVEAEIQRRQALIGLNSAGPSREV